MSFRPHRSLFVRLRAGLPTSHPQQKLRAGLHERSKTHVGARNIAGYASQSNISTPDEILADLSTVPGSHDSIAGEPTSTISDLPNNYAAEPSTGTHVEADRSELLFVPDRMPTTSRVRSPRGPDPNVLHEQVGKVRYGIPLKNGKVRWSVRNVSREVWESEKSIRSKTLFDSPAALHQWMAARDEIGEAIALGREPQKHIVQLDLSEGDEALLDKLKADSKEDFREAWQALSKTEKIGHWHRLSLWLLYRYPRLVPDFLHATCRCRDKPVLLMVSKCITHLNRFFPQYVDRPLITICLHPDAWPILNMPQSTARLFIMAADRADVYYAWSVTRKKRTHMTPATLLCYMKRFTEFEDVDSAIKALQAVQNMRHPDFSLDSEEVIRHCCKLLTLDSVVNDSSDRNFRILPRLLEMGVQPTRDMMNVVLSNAFKTGDSQVGYDIHDYMKSHKLHPDSYTYLALLTDAVATGNRERLGVLLQEIQPKEELHKNKWISSKILHSHFAFTAKRINIDDDPNEVFYSMLDMYNQLHDITPLKELSIIPYHYTAPAGSSNSPPSVVALYIMIATYLRCLKNLVSAERVYDRYRSLVLQGHEVIAPLAATDHTYNEFLVAFRKDPRGLRSAVRLVEDMLHAAGGDGRTQKIKNSEMHHSRPSVRTWTMLMSAFVFNKQALAAEKVRAMMSKHNVKYSLDTWNMIINNYANSQQVSRLAESIKQMEREGFAMDEYSVRSLRYLRDPERLWVAIDELDQASDPGSASSDSELEKGKEAASLLDHGLQRLKDNMKPKA
ncbi:pentatricopeptide repeat protein [Aspergillus lucknowensis]|uniref:Pentatricopeptide repeat protein n=1 Tax=Aspergillus lucknowensis TaxID=176173 RepID=A0ABR4M6G9_9EURO